MSRTVRNRVPRIVRASCFVAAFALSATCGVSAVAQESGHLPVSSSEISSPLPKKAGNTKVVIPSFGGNSHEDVFVFLTAKLGSKVYKGDVLGEAETTKSTAEIYAPVSGVLIKICYKYGATAHVGDTIAVIGPSGKPKHKARC